MQGATTINVPYATGDTTKRIARRDALLNDAPNAAVRFEFDTAFGYCYPGGPLAGRPAPAAPANNALVQDIAEVANGKVVKGAKTIAYAGGGFDFSDCTALSHYLEIPASVAADIWTPYGVGAVSQRLLAVLYVRLPAKADWNAASVFPMLGWGNVLYTSGPELFLLSQTTTGGVPGLNVRRQINGATFKTVTVNPADASFWTLAQIAIWRNATEFAMRMRTVAESLVASLASDVDNVTDFSALTGKVGVGAHIVSASGTAQKWRLYRGWIENLARSGRDPITVLDADWARVQARIAASAAANGGTSQIFN